MREDLKRMVGVDYMKQGGKEDIGNDGRRCPMGRRYLFNVGSALPLGTMMLTKRGSETVITQRLKGKSAAP